MGIAQTNLATGGGCIALSTPYGTGNWFHQTWTRAEKLKMIFYLLNYLGLYTLKEMKHGEKKKQDELLGDPRMAAQECDCDFSTSGDMYFTLNI